MCERDPTIYLSLATLSVSVVVAIIAWQQKRLAGHKLRLELFERRYKVYEAAMTFVTLIRSEGARFTNDDVRNFNIGTRDAVFLFRKNVSEHLELIRSRAYKMQNLGKDFRGLPMSDERERLIKLQTKEFEWLVEQLETGYSGSGLQSLFLRYLGFQRIR